MKIICSIVVAAAGLGALGSAWAQFVPGASASGAGMDPVIQGNWQTITHPPVTKKAPADTQSKAPRRGRGRRQADSNTAVTSD